MTIADVGSIMAEVNVDEADIARVGVGQQAKVFPAAFPDQPVTGKVESVAMAPKSALPGAQARAAAMWSSCAWKTRSWRCARA
jgi:HlyD family secretion protein